MRRLNAVCSTKVNLMRLKASFCYGPSIGRHGITMKITIDCLALDALRTGFADALCVLRTDFTG